MSKTRSKLKLSVKLAGGGRRVERRDVKADGVRILALGRRAKGVEAPPKDLTRLNEVAFEVRDVDRDHNSMVSVGIQEARGLAGMRTVPHRAPPRFDGNCRSKNELRSWR